LCNPPIPSTSPPLLILLLLSKKEEEKELLPLKQPRFPFFFLRKKKRKWGEKRGRGVLHKLGAASLTQVRGLHKLGI
jgi:hypothetical protein